MTVDRRTFLKTSGALAATGALPLALAAKPARKPLRILILGGTGFLGPSTIEVALARGHKVSMFNRGRTRPELFPSVEKLHGDRDPRKGEGLKALEQGEWDVVIDNSGYYPRMVKASAELVAKRCRQYLYISSISAYKEPNPLNGVETAPLATMPDPTAETMGPNYEWYGALKALCEQAAEAALPGRTTLIRPGYIVGPDDPSGRFTYWPVRFAQGGEVPVPGSPEDPVQVIDVRDLGAWLVLLAERNITGAFHATGAEKPHRWGRIIEACRSAAGVPSTPLWLPTDFVAQQEGLAYPIWAPPTGDTAGFHRWNVAKALKAGLRFRPIEQTVADTLAWYQAESKVEKGRTRLAGPAPEAETKAVAAWKAKKG